MLLRNFQLNSSHISNPLCHNVLCYGTAQTGSKWSSVEVQQCSEVLVKYGSQSAERIAQNLCVRRCQRRSGRGSVGSAVNSDSGSSKTATGGAGLRTVPPHCRPTHNPGGAEHGQQGFAASLVILVPPLCLEETSLRICQLR